MVFPLQFADRLRRCRYNLTYAIYSVELFPVVSYQPWNWTAVNFAYKFFRYFYCSRSFSLSSFFGSLYSLLCNVVGEDCSLFGLWFAAFHGRLVFNCLAACVLFRCLFCMFSLELCTLCIVLSSTALHYRISWCYYSRVDNRLWCVAITNVYDMLIIFNVCFKADG